MWAKNGKALKITLVLAVTCAIFMISPLGASALPLDPFADGSVLLNVSYAETGGDWKFTYSFSQRGS